jgi:hypothetical protein
MKPLPRITLKPLKGAAAEKERKESQAEARELKRIYEPKRKATTKGKKL